MSVSVFNNFHYDNDFDHVRRNLFGPVDRKECSRFAEEELAKHQMSACQKWGFDFVRGRPLEDTKLFLWERVPPTNEIPEMYALSRAAHIRPIDPDRTPSKKRRQMRRDSFLDLYDELHEKTNRYSGSGESNVLDLSFEDVDGGHTSASSCEEDSFEEEIDNNMLCNISWMPKPSKLPPSSMETATQVETTQSTIDAVPSSSNHDALRPSCDTSCCDKTTNSNCSKSYTNASSSSGARVLRNSPRTRPKRQCKITDYLKERKRPQPTQKKNSPKKARISAASSGSITSHFRPSAQ